VATGARGGGRVTDQRVWTPDEVRALGVRTTVPIAGEIIAGLCKDESYRAVQRGTFPVSVVRCGRRMVVPVAPILELLGIDPAVNAASPAPPAEPVNKDTTAA
jgi:hypothetical protein